MLDKKTYLIRVPCTSPQGISDPPCAQSTLPCQNSKAIGDQRTSHSRKLLLRPSRKLRPVPPLHHAYPLSATTIQSSSLSVKPDTQPSSQAHEPSTLFTGVGAASGHHRGKSWRDGLGERSAYRFSVSHTRKVKVYESPVTCQRFGGSTRAAGRSSVLGRGT